MKRNWLMATVLGMSLSVCGAEMPEASAKALPRWRGFNLLEKFYFTGQQKRFLESDFRMIHELGFNFVRLPMDYRHWIVDGDWNKIDENVLKDVDEAIEFGKKYNVHVCINFHRAPGYTVATPKEKTNLWKDAETQRVCAMHWATFAKRYKGISNANLSFNLFNEPGDIKGEDYANVVKIMADAIHKEDPERLIICDGLSWGGKPCMELAALGVAQATRGYRPMEISHYKASWAGGERYPMPNWPLCNAVGWLAGDAKPDMNHVMTIDWDCAASAKLRLKVGVVSQRLSLHAEADGVKIWEHDFVSGPGKGEWKKEVFSQQWRIYQNVFDMDCVMDIPANTKKVTITATRGDWANFSELGVTVGEKPELVIGLSPSYGSAPVPFGFVGGQWKFDAKAEKGREWLWKEGIEPWLKLRAQGVGVIVGEFGAFNKTPHDVVLSWLEDNLKNWQEAGFGWAMWNFRGAFGVMDSGREDVQYEDYQGHKLDRKLLELLQKY